MALKTKTIKIGEYDINIIQFNAFQALKLRKELVESVKKQVGDISLDESASILKSVAGLIYEIPGELFMKLFKNCSAIEIGQLSVESNFNSVFENNLDGTIELAMEVLDFNGFFSLNILSTLAKKIPMLAPMEEAMRQSLGEMKNN